MTYRSQSHIVRATHCMTRMQDLAGFGAIVGHLKELIVKILDLITTRERRRLENDALRIENARKRRLAKSARKPK